MATYKRPLVDKQRNTIHPITCTRAVYDDDGVELDEILKFRNYRVEVSASSPKISTEVRSVTLTARVLNGQADVTSMFSNNNYIFKWTRISSDTTHDVIWNNDPGHTASSLTSIIITSSDVPDNATFVCTLYNVDSDHTTIASGQVIIVDITDIGVLSAYINSNSPTEQLVKSNTYSPDYTSNPLVLTPVVYLDNLKLEYNSVGLTLTWRRRINGVEFDLTSEETVNNGILTVSNNMTDVSVPFIAYVLHARYVGSDPNYYVESESYFGLSRVTGSETESGIIFSIYSQDGQVFNDGDTSKTINTFAYHDGTAISGATYKWYKYDSGSWDEISGATSSSYSVNKSDINGEGSYKCRMTYLDVNYEDVITFVDRTDSYQTIIESTFGDIFRNAEESTCLIANLYYNGNVTDQLKCNYTDFSTYVPTNPHEGQYYHKILSDSPNMPLMRYNGSYWVDVTDSAEYGYTEKYKWYRRDANGNPMDNGNSFAEGKVIFIKSDPLNADVTYICEVIDSNNETISISDYIIRNITNVIISDTPPVDPVDGMIWVDSSVTPNVMKIYMNGEWKVVGASDENKNKVFTSVPIPPYRVGDLWLRVDENGDNVIYYCKTARTSGPYDPDDWIPSNDYQTPTEVIDELQNYAQNVISPLYGLPDKTIVAWFQDTDPSVNWTTDALKTEHLSDTWYCSNYGGITGNIKLQRYTWSLSTGYMWEEITNLSAIENYNRAVRAQDTADGKRRVFYGDSEPTPPYDEGDLWSQGEDGNLLVCNHSRTENESFDISDWEESARYTVDRELLQKQIDGRIQIWFQDLDPEYYAGIVSFTWSNENLSVGINGDEFETSGRQSGTYEFIYNGSSWTLNGSAVSLGSYGIQVIVGTPVNNDKITVVFQKPSDDVPWSTAVKAKHCGDLWYAPSTKVTKRYTEYIENNISSFGWEISTSLEAIRAAQNAQAAADGNLITFYIKNAISYSSSSEIDVSIVEFDWNNVVDETGTYLFEYDGSKWELTVTYPDSSTEGPYEVNLSDYGIRITNGNPDNESVITVNFTYNHPEPPYDVGDLWVSGDSGEIMVCKVERESGESYVKTDWDYGNNLNVFVNTTYKEDIISLEGLIDNKIDAWFQSDNPATAWTTSELKKAHEGDVWYKDYNHIYRYSDDHQWIAITDASTLAAYRNAAGAQDTRDGKRRLFVGPDNPIPPYDRGDIWLQDTSDPEHTTLYCDIARREGSIYVLGDFVTPDLYSDYKLHVGTTAPSDTSILWLDITDISNPVLKQCMNYGEETPVWGVVGVPTKIYTSQPSPPYNVGDTWVYYDSSNSLASIKVCIVPKAVGGTYDANDWVESTSNVVISSSQAPTDITKLWYNTSNNILYVYDTVYNQWRDIGAVSTNDERLERLSTIITVLQKNVSRVIDSTQRLDVVSSNGNVYPNLDKNTWTSGDETWINSGGTSGKGPSPYVSLYGEYEYYYGTKTPQVDPSDSIVGWRKRFLGDALVGSSGTASELENYEYISYTVESGQTLNVGDTITLRNYDASTSLGFVVSDYKNKYEMINNQIGDLVDEVEVISTGFEFQSDGLHVFDGRSGQQQATRSEVVIASDSIMFNANGSTNMKLENNSNYVGVDAPNVKVSNVMNVINTLILGKYKIDCSGTSGEGISLSYIG